MSSARVAWLGRGGPAEIPLAHKEIIVLFVAVMAIPTTNRTVVLPTPAAVGTETGASILSEGLVVAVGCPDRLPFAATPRIYTGGIDCGAIIDTEMLIEKALTVRLVGRSAVEAMSVERSKMEQKYPSSYRRDRSGVVQLATDPGVHATWHIVRQPRVRYRHCCCCCDNRFCSRVPHPCRRCGRCGLTCPPCRPSLLL